MIVSAPRKALALHPLALVSALSLSFCAHAQDAGMPQVIVTGARFPGTPELAPIGATVITADQIRAAGVADVNEAVRKIGGVFGRQSLDSSPDFALDLRGFGANSSENMVVMLDGVRMSDNELSPPVLSTIPIDTIERIEISRGGSSVLYGEGATGGVIQIFTRRAVQAGARGSVRAEAGQFHAHDVRASASQSWNGVALDAAVGHQGTDNYRADSAFRQTALSAGALWTLGAGRVGVRIDSARADSRFPGSLTLAQFAANPRQSATPGDFGSLDSDRISTFIDQRFGGVEFAAELSHRQKTVKANYVLNFGAGDFDSKLAYDSAQTQFSPRLRQISQYGGMLNELTGGIDLIRWKRVTQSDFSRADARQTSKAIYLRDEIGWSAAHDGRLSLGARHEVYDKDYVDPLGAAAADPSVQTQNAWEAQGSYSVRPGLTLHAKAGQSYRVANADENSFRASSSVLKAQTSHDLEAGITVGDSAGQLSARAFRHRLANEIFFDPTIGYGTNANLDPTERRGVEIDADARLAAAWRVSAHLQHVRASFTAGPNAGREMVLVPKNLVSARLTWVPAAGHSADLGVQWVDSQRYGSDFTNACGARIPSYATVDARYGRTLGRWELALAGQNLAGKEYFSNAFGCRSGIYPGNGRQVKLSARYDF